MDTGSTEQPAWWRPFVLKPIPRVIIMVVPLLAVVGLELTLHISRQHSGLTTITSRHRERYASRLVPAAVFTGIRTLLTSLTFNVSLMTPLSAMRKGPCAANLGFFDAPLTRSPLLNLWSASQKKQLALFTSVVTASAAFFLVTISSGLFVTGDYTIPSNITQLTWLQPYANGDDSAVHGISTTYNVSEPLHLAQDNGAVTLHLISNSVIELNLTYPPWTYENLAFPQIVISQNATTKADKAKSITAIVPALRSKMNCEVLSNDSLNVSYASHWLINYGQNFTYLEVTVKTLRNSSGPHCNEPVDTTFNTF